MSHESRESKGKACRQIANQRESIDMFKQSLEAMGAVPSPLALLELFDQQLTIMETIMDAFPTWADSAGYIS